MDARRLTHELPELPEEIHGTPLAWEVARTAIGFVSACLLVAVLAVVTLRDDGAASPQIPTALPALGPSSTSLDPPGALTVFYLVRTAAQADIVDWSEDALQSSAPDRTHRTFFARTEAEVQLAAQEILEHLMLSAYPARIEVEDFRELDAGDDP
jgi:hypothetical protein